MAGSRARQRTEAPERRRGDLLDAALAIVVDKGVTRLTVDEVVARAEVAKGTFYLYFRSKEQLITALQDRFVDDLTALQRAELDQIDAGDWLGRLLCWMESSLRGYLAHARLHDALFHHSQHGHEADLATNSHAALLAEILEAGTAAGDFALSTPRTAAVLLYNVMHGSAHYLVEQAERSPDLVEAVIAESLTLCRRYVDGT
ncbi:TetR/AcrR family transcriptional regulator [Kibdelosporangium persicum]|uniref:HTH-type transcriptional regulator EthR n=1 Tax=Kibdelosporangium persicum TaxID=2698649 RepID=A0ABX2FGF0_9PSEU|nr:TetR/AcrR family transcriptional regulator [Kibdelosporangium persicum]NRN70450.1 HTH-type transcriptional regulator EthR [Kibdelosporangium persicum]